MRKWVFPNSRLPQELYIFPLNISSLNASVRKSIFSVVYWAVGGLDPSGHPWIYPMVSILFLFPISLVAEFILNPIQLFPSPIGLSGWLVCPPGGLGRETHHGDCHSDWLCCWWVMPITITILITIFILSLLRIRKIMMITMMERWQKYRKWLWCWWKLNLKELKRWLQSDMKAFIWLQFCVKQFLGLPFLDCSLSLF